MHRNNDIIIKNQVSAVISGSSDLSKIVPDYYLKIVPVAFSNI